jgi:hypothetical protein
MENQMARYTQETVFSFGKLQEYRAVIPDAAGSVKVEFWNGTGWTEDQGSPMTKPDKIFTLGVNVRLTPSASHGFWIEEGDGI